MRATSALVTARGLRLERGTPTLPGPCWCHPGHPAAGTPWPPCLRLPRAIAGSRGGLASPSRDGSRFGGVPADRGSQRPALGRGRRGDPAAGGSRVPLFLVQGFPGWSLWQLRRLSPGLLGAAPTSQTGKLRQAVGPGAGGRREGTPRAGFLEGAPLSQPARGGALLPKRPDRDNGGKSFLHV